MGCCWCRQRRNNNGNGIQSRNRTPDSNEEFFDFESQAARNRTPDSNEELFDFESQAAKFVSKMGMELDKKIVEVRLNMEEFSGGERQMMQDANENREETRKGIRVNRVDFGTYFHGFGLRKNDVIFLLNGQPIISEASVNMNLLRIINSSFNSKLYMNLYRADAMSSMVNTERPEPSGLIAEPSTVKEVNAEPDAESLVVKAKTSVLNALQSVVNGKVVKLDNEGDEPRDKDPEKLKYVEHDTYKIKSVYYRGGRYLTVNERSRSNPIVLSNGNENDSVEFTMTQYQPIDWSQPGNPEIVTLQHKASREYILADDDGLSLPNPRIHPTPPPSPPPSPPPTPRLIKNTSVYLFKVIKPDRTSSCKCHAANTVTFQPINRNGTVAIGFKKHTNKASLMSPKKCETHFELFNNSTAN